MFIQQFSWTRLVPYRIVEPFFVHATQEDANPCSEESRIGSVHNIFVVPIPSAFGQLCRWRGPGLLPTGYSVGFDPACVWAQSEQKQNGFSIVFGTVWRGDGSSGEVSNGRRLSKGLFLQETFEATRPRPSGLCCALGRSSTGSQPCHHQGLHPDQGTCHAGGVVHGRPFPFALGPLVQKSWPPDARDPPGAASRSPTLERQCGTTFESVPHRGRGGASGSISCRCQLSGKGFGTELPHSKHGSTGGSLWSAGQTTGAPSRCAWWKRRLGQCFATAPHCVFRWLGQRSEVSTVVAAKQGRHQSGPTPWRHREKHRTDEQALLLVLQKGSQFARQCGQQYQHDPLGLVRDLWQRRHFSFPTQGKSRPRDCEQPGSSTHRFCQVRKNSTNSARSNTTHLPPRAQLWSGELEFLISYDILRSLWSFMILSFWKGGFAPVSPCFTYILIYFAQLHPEPEGFTVCFTP